MAARQHQASKGLTRRPRDVAFAVLGFATLGLSWLLALRRDIHPVEVDANRALNQLPDHGRVIWPVMQLGSLAAVPIASIVAYRVSRSPRLAAGLLVAGIGAWGLSKPVKTIVGRDRPAGHLEEVNVREATSGLGFVSGHAAVSMSMATVLVPYLPGRWRWLPPAIAGVVGLSRVYYGAHLPLDIVGGAGLGLATGSLTNLALGVPSQPVGETIG